MNLHEYQSKARFGAYDIPVPHGKVATTPDEVYKIATELGGPVVVKSQVLVGGRGESVKFHVRYFEIEPGGQSWTTCSALRSSRVVI